MKFIIDNIFLIALALVSGGALLVPYLQQRGNKLSLLQATQMLNQGKVLCWMCVMPSNSPPATCATPATSP